MQMQDSNRNAELSICEVELEHIEIFQSGLVLWDRMDLSIAETC